MIAGHGDLSWTHAIRWLFAGGFVLAAHAAGIWFFVVQTPQSNIGGSESPAVMIDLEPVAILQTQPVERLDQPLPPEPVEPVQTAEAMAPNEPLDTIDALDPVEPEQAVEPIEPLSPETFEAVPEEANPEPAVPIEPEEPNPAEPTELAAIEEISEAVIAPAPRPRTERPRSVEKPRQTEQSRRKAEQKPARQPAQQHPAEQRATRPPGTNAPTISPDRWRNQVNGHIARFQRPAPGGGSGTVRVRFTIDARGRIIGVSIAASSGNPALDAEAVSMVRRASPVPPPPAELLRGGTLSLSVPLRYN